MDGQRFDRLAKELANGSDRRGFLKRIAGIAAGAAAVAVPVKASATIEAYCSSDYECDSYNNEVCKYGKCVCDYGYKDCNGTCIPEYDCCSDYDCGKNEVCNYGTCECPTYDGYKVCESDGSCVAEYACCSAYDCGKNEVCDYGTCTCPTYDGYKVCDYDGSCVPAYGCCGDSDCGYGETCEYGTCASEPKGDDSQAPESNTPGPSNPNYSKQLARSCNTKCLRAGRKSAKQKKQRLTSARARRMRNTCRRRCAANSR